MENQSPDAKLVNAYLSGQNRAFEILFKRYERPLFSFIIRFIGNRESAEDIFQKTWMKVLKGLSKYEERGKFSSWLFGIANNCCIDYVRRKAGRKQNDFVSAEGLDSLPSEDSRPDDILTESERKEWLKTAITKLPPEQREVVLLRMYGEMPFKEIANILNSSMNTVLGRMHYAVKNLRKMAK